MSIRQKRFSPLTLQDIINTAADELNIDQKAQLDPFARLHLVSYCSIQGDPKSLPNPKTCWFPIFQYLPDLGYNRYVAVLEKSGATIVVDEESNVGQALANDLIILFQRPNQAAMA